MTPPPLRHLLLGGLAAVGVAFALVLGVAFAAASPSASASPKPTAAPSPGRTASSSPTAPPSHTATACPAPFEILHDTRIGTLQLPRGSYDITVVGMPCRRASSLLAALLKHWDGKLPEPWRYTTQGVGQGAFTGSDGQQFAIARTSQGGDAHHPASGLACPRPFTLTQNDRIGALTLDRGSYTINRLDPLAPSCTEAAALLADFLEDFDGKLPSGWTLVPAVASFIRGSASYGFRLQPATSAVGGQSFPTRSIRCPATFLVRHAVRVAGVSFPAGTYWINVGRSSRIGCRRASSLLANFLARRAALPRGWALDSATGRFGRSRDSAYFQAKPAFLVR